MWCIVLMCLTTLYAGAATIQIKAPLQSYYRPGRYLPLHVVASGVRGNWLTISAPQLVSVRIATPGGSVDTEVPLLPLGVLPAQLELADETPLAPVPMTWQPLGEEERLVGLMGIAPARAPQIFAGQRVRFLTLNADSGGLFSTRPASAWETLDALIIDESALTRMKESQLSVLLASGTVVAAQTADRPSSRWPWIHDGAFWILRFSPLGPRGINDPAVYRPTYGWIRGWSSGFLGRALASAALFVALAALLSLGRARSTAVLFVLACVIFCVAWIAIDRTRSRTIQLRGNIDIDDGSLLQHDAWTWEAALSDARATWVADGCAHPFLASRMQLQNMDLQMQWNPASHQLQFEYALSPGRSIALMRRSVTPDASSKTFDASIENGFLLDLFNTSYADATTRLTGTPSDVGTDAADVPVLMAHRSAQ